MNFLEYILSALALMLVLEGLIYFASPNLLRAVATWIDASSDQSLKTIGIAMVVAGITLLIILRLWLFA
ncbi:MAG: DUF2065 domain-containing protein [Nitrospinota bacterium]